MNQNEIRAQFPICEVQTYLDAGFSNGGCKAAQQALELFFEEQFTARAEGKKRWNEAVLEVREKTAELLGRVSPQNIAITKNTVEGLNIIAQGFPWQAGDNVIINDQEHTSNLMPWLALKERGVDCRVVKAVNYELPVELIAEAIDEHTKIVAISHVQSGTGYRCDLQRLAKICRERDVFLVVDAIQSLGLLPCNAKEWGVDAVAAGGHKSLLAVPGVGILYVAPKLLDCLHPIYGGISPVKTIDREQWSNQCNDESSAEKLELSNLNYPGVYALRAGLDLILGEGVESIWERVSALSAKLHQGLRSIGYHVISTDSETERSGIVSVLVPEPAEMKAWFAERGIVISKMDAGYVRFSLGIYSNEADVECALENARIYYKEKLK